MKILLIVLIIVLMFGSCTTAHWDDMSQSEKRETVLWGVAGVLYAGGMTYWIMNPTEVPEGWPE